eukprot:2061382-Heterocapsa_arctica.AAC.1
MQAEGTSRKADNTSLQASPSAITPPQQGRQRSKGQVVGTHLIEPFALGNHPTAPGSKQRKG